MAKSSMKTFSSGCFLRRRCPPRSRRPAPSRGGANVKRRPPPAIADEMLRIAESLQGLAAQVAEDGVAKALSAHAAALEKLCSQGHAVQATAPAADQHSGTAQMQGCRDPRLFREEAAALVQQTGCPGELIQDMHQVPLASLKDKAALSGWRSCPGIRFYRSPTVTAALRLICSAPVPGLGGVNYLDVFKSLTGKGWDHNIFLFGGLVRDILRRKVGNDIDVTFSAPAAELQEICKQQGYKCFLEGDYILIGDERGEEYLEGMVMTHNCVTPPENSDFSMNWVFYDFVNDVIIDKTGRAVEAIRGNRLEIPCARDKWDRWVEIGGARVLFRYYKFLVRGFVYDDVEMTYIAEKLLGFWHRNPEDTMAQGREVLAALAASKDTAKFGILRELVFKSFMLASSQMNPPAIKTSSRPRSEAGCRRGQQKGVVDRCGNEPVHFFSGSIWWQKGWMQVLSV
eukprot:TRINITY_DN72522_c0_g1_i2.p1 TRINITY_DN72522_c0_g1~~TRINITY_DN72522_c0_g1_i2.p1  ORF type:complete len:456 (-),score=91.52 TRINITY_DN72522_c0_g1_i2:263-1630(-)